MSMTKKAKKTVVDTSTWIKFKTEPASEEEYRILADGLLKWAQEPSSLSINDFPLSIMMSPQIFHKLPSTSKYFYQAYDIALQLVGTRREKLAQEGLLSRQIVLQTMPLYDPNYRKWLMSLRDKAENIGETKIIVVNVPSFVSSDEVPHINDR